MFCWQEFWKRKIYIFFRKNKTFVKFFVLHLWKNILQKCSMSSGAIIYIWKVAHFYLYFIFYFLFFKLRKNVGQTCMTTAVLLLFYNFFILIFVFLFVIVIILAFFWFFYFYFIYIFTKDIFLSHKLSSYLRSLLFIFSTCC